MSILDGKSILSLEKPRGSLSTKLAVQSLTMHSSGITGGLTGPGMHYHRRAESAPELDAIDRSRIGSPRLGSDPAMAIEEEEEEELGSGLERERCARYPDSTTFGGNLMGPF